MAFSVFPGIGAKRFLALLKYFDSAQKAWEAQEFDFEKIGIGKKLFQKFDKFRRSFDLASYKEKLKNKKIDFLTLLDSNYPWLLKNLPEPPIIIYFKGSFSNDLFKQTIAVVGTRRMTNYGREVTEKLTDGLIAAGFTIVSGLALGVDAMAHKSAIEANGKTIAVLGNGVDNCFPRENQVLYQKIIAGSGAVISTFPPGAVPSRGTFPARNRIISGLSQAVLVTEAGEDSGALITAGYAKDFKRPVFAVPGPINSLGSRGTASLIKNGAVLVQDVSDVLEYFKIKAGRSLDKETQVIKGLSKEEKNVFKLLLDENLHINQLVKKTAVSISKLNIILSSLELKGVVKNFGGGQFGKA